MSNTQKETTNAAAAKKGRKPAAKETSSKKTEESADEIEGLESHDEETAVNDHVVEDDNAEEEETLEPEDVDEFESEEQETAEELNETEPSVEPQRSEVEEETKAEDSDSTKEEEFKLIDVVVISESPVAESDEATEQPDAVTLDEPAEELVEAASVAELDDEKADNTDFVETLNGEVEYENWLANNTRADEDEIAAVRESLGLA